MSLKSLKLSVILFVCLFFWWWACHVACGILVPQLGIELGSSAVRAWSPNHWTARELPQWVYNMVTLCSFGQLPVWCPPIKSGRKGCHFDTLFPGDSDGKESAYHERDLDLIPGLGRSLGEGNDYPFQYSCLENSMDRLAWRATVQGVPESWLRLSN